MKKSKGRGEIRAGGHVGKRHVRGKAGRVGRPVPSPALKQRSSGKLSAKAAHANRVAQSNAGRTVGVRSIQRMVDTGKRTPDYRHRGLDREDRKLEGWKRREEEREWKRAERIVVKERRCLQVEQRGRDKRELAIVRKMHRDFLRREAVDGR